MDEADSKQVSVLPGSYNSDSAMRKPIWITGALVLLICAWVLFRNLTQNEQSALKIAHGPPTHRMSQPAATPSGDTVDTNSNVVPRQTGEAALLFPSTKLANLNAKQTRILSDWQHPIEFYGRVVDDSNNPIEGASIGFGWPELPTDDGGRSSSTKSDTDGRFSLQHGAKGPNLSVSVSKEGYYAPHFGQWSFSYAFVNDPYTPDIANPFIFRLRKKGSGVALLTSQNGVGTQVGVRVPTDGGPVGVDFFKKGPNPSGQLEISQIKPASNTATEWSFRLSITDGGLVENQDDYQFQAPETGYQQKVEYKFSKSDSNWTTQVSKQFYIAFGNPRKFGWLRFDSNVGQQTVFLTYAINPDGSRNLEPAN